MKLIPIPICGLLLLSAPALAGVSGRVTFAGEAPPEAPIKMNADAKCEALYDTPPLSSHYVVSDDGGLADVFVYVQEAPEGEWPAPDEPARISQKGCLYIPTVGGIQVDQTLHIENEDDNLHNVRALARSNRPFNLGQPGPGVREKSFKVAEEAVKFKCDVHPWMESHVFVLEHPFFAVTGEDGAFEIEGLPAGSYTLVAWHSRAGRATAEITVDSDGSASASFELTAE